VQLWLAQPTTSTRRHQHQTSTPTRQAKCQFSLNIFTTSIYFVNLLYMPWLLFRSLPLDMFGGLAMPTRRSPDLRVPIFLSCAMFPSPSTCSGACPCQSKPTSPMCSSFNCFTFVMSIRCCVVAKPGS
jgi:hypothetical protein